MDRKELNRKSLILIGALMFLLFEAAVLRSDIFSDSLLGHFCQALSLAIFAWCIFMGAICCWENFRQKLPQWPAIYMAGWWVSGTVALFLLACYLGFLKSDVWPK